MAQRSGSADLPLHGGRVPKWLGDRMTRLGEIFDKAYQLGSVTSPPITDVQSISVPPGSANIVEFKCEVPGRFVLVDHALSRAEHGLAGYLIVEGPEHRDIFDAPPNEHSSGH